ncbi:hypothetical protein ICL16_19480 [Iningainema sp. BLCCT55]|uniref:Uncharacterized protein n=1 Tax=Iningainema tapete BLCC-T55 TaxID=2748662 RepID=A0A8J7C867_9CYAN|nr:hypothetical protein [Iningainema tapete BLCC-T55]
MLATADQRYDDASNEPDNPGNVSFGAVESPCWECLVGQGLVVVIEQC